MADDARPADAAQPRPSFAPLAALLLVAAALRFFRLDSQLWIDEISALVNSLQRPAVDIATQWPGAASHILYEILARICLVLFGQHPWAIRLPAALFGVAGVWAFYLLVVRLLPRRHALALAALFATSYNHIYFSQNARGYTAMIFFFLLATHALLRAHEERRMSTALGVTYAVAGALSAYSNLFGIVILPAHVAVVLAAEWIARRRGTPTGFPLRRALGFAALGLLLSAVLYAPFASSILHFAAERSRIPSEGARIGWPFLREVIEGLSAAFLGLAGVAVALAVGLVGLFVWWRRSVFALAILLAPLVLQTLIFLAIGTGIHPRYYANALPVVYLLGGTGVITVLAAIARLVGRSAGRAAWLEVAALTALVLLSAVPLVRYYQTPFQDFTGARALVDSLAAPGDVKVGVYLAGHVLKGYYHADYASVDNLAELEAVEQPGKTVWLVTTLERILDAHDAALVSHIRARYRRVKVLPGRVGDGQMRIYTSAAGAGGG